MPDELKTAETNTEVEVDSHADVNQSESEQLNDVEFGENSATKEEQPKPEEEQKQTQTSEQNSENARRRREAERQAEIKSAQEKAREQAIIEILNGKNPYTNEEIKDKADIDEYLVMKEIEKNGGDPLADYSKYKKQKERERQAETEKQEKQKQWYADDSKDFATKHPDVNLQNLIKDENFQRYAGGKVGNVPLSQIYEGYIESVSVYEKKAKQMARQMLANQKATRESRFRI
jgi:hypothetical protein